MKRAALHDPLVERARRAERKILEEIDSFLSSVLTVYDRPLILRRLERDSKARAKGIMTSFGAYAKRWENKELQAFYEEQVGKADREMRKAGIDLKRALLGEIDPEELHGRAYGTIRDEFSSRFSDLLTLVSRQTGDIYTQVQRQSARFAFMETDDVKATIRGMRRRFMETGMYDLGFRDKSGRIWHMDAYTDMVGRTVTANARRTAMEMEFLAHGENLVRLSYHPTKCAMCAPWNGVIVALMEPTKDYPYTLQDAYESGWGHPNCLHGFTLYVEGFSDPGPSEPSMTTEDKDEPYKPPKPGGAEGSLKNKVASMFNIFSGKPIIIPSEVDSEVREIVKKGVLNERDAIELGDLLYNHMKIGVISSRKPQERILDILSRYRTFGSAPVGFTKASDAKAMKAVVEGYAYLPNDWVNNAMKGKVIYASIAKKRAFTKNIDAHTREISVPKGRFAIQYALHEWGHAMEDVPIVSALEHEFYTRRTLGFPVEQLKDIYPNKKYDIHEMTRRDRFINAYMGKFYGGRRYEIVSMGLEYVFFNPKEIWRKDPEYVKFILGLLLGGKA